MTVLVWSAVAQCSVLCCIAAFTAAMSTAAERRGLLTAVCRSDTEDSTPLPSDGPASASAATEATAVLLSALQTGQCSLTSLIVELRAELTAEEEEVRRRGLGLLSRAITALPSLTASQAETLAVFFDGRLQSDQRSVPEASPQPSPPLPTSLLLTPWALCSVFRCAREVLQCLLSLLRSSSSLLSFTAVTALNRTSGPAINTASQHCLRLKEEGEGGRKAANEEEDGGQGDGRHRWSSHIRPTSPAVLG